MVSRDIGRTLPWLELPTVRAMLELVSLQSRLALVDAPKIILNSFESTLKNIETPVHSFLLQTVYTLFHLFYNDYLTWLAN